MEGVLSLRWSSWVVFIFFLTVLCVRTTIICALSNLSLVKAYMESNNRIQYEVFAALPLLWLLYLKPFL